MRKSLYLPDSGGVRDMVHKILPIQKQEEEDAAQHTSTHACLKNNNYVLFYKLFLLHTHIISKTLFIKAAKKKDFNSRTFSVKKESQENLNPFRV
jgi:hypothetical protein